MSCNSWDRLTQQRTTASCTVFSGSPDITVCEKSYVYNDLNLEPNSIEYLNTQYFCNAIIHSKFLGKQDSYK